MEDAILKEWENAIQSAPYSDRHLIHHSDAAALFAGCLADYQPQLLVKKINLIRHKMDECELSLDELLQSLFAFRDHILKEQISGRIKNPEIEWPAVAENIQTLILKFPAMLHGRFHGFSNSEEASSILSLMLKAIENIGEGILIIEPRANGKMLFVNRTLEKITGFESQDLLGKSFFTLFGIYHTPELEQDIFPAAIISGWQGEVTIQGANLLPLSISVNIQPVRDENNELLALVGNFRDITREKRHRLEMELREEQITLQNTRLTFLDDLSKIVNATLDIKETLFNFTEKFQRIIAYQSISFFLPISPKEGIYRVYYACDSKGHGKFLNDMMVTFEASLDFRDMHKVYFEKSLQHSLNQEYFLQLWEQDVKELICFPIHFKDEILAIIGVSFSNFYAINSEDLQFIEQIINHLTVALKNAVQYDQLERQNRKLNLFHNLFSYIKNNASANFILNEALIDLAISFSYDHLAIYQKSSRNSWTRVANHSLQGISSKIFPEVLPTDLELPKTPLFHVSQDAAHPFAQQLSVTMKEMKPTTFLLLKDASSIHGEVLLMGVCNHQLPDLSYTSHVDLMRSILKELTLALDHNRLFQQTIQAENEWKMTFNEVQIGLAVVDKYFNVKRANKSFWGIFNKDFQRTPFSCGEIFDIVAYENAIFSKASLEDISAPLHWNDKNTGKFLIRRFFPLFNRLQEFVGGIFTIQDVTQEREQEARIRYLSRFPEVNPNLVLSLDRKGTVIYANNTARNVVKRMQLSSPKHLIPVTLLFELQNNSFPTGVAQEYIQKLQDRVVQFTAFEPDDDQSIYLYGIDITDRLEMQDKLVLTERMRAIGEIASGAAHDFNNYLMTIIGRTQLMMMNVKKKSLREDLEVIDKAAKDGAEMVRKLQELNHKRNKRESKPLYLKDLINDSLLFSQQKIKPQTQIKGQTTFVNTKLDPSLVVYGNSAEFREIFTNLIFNAFDAMPDGGELSIETWRDAKNQEAVVKLTDTGIGMSPEVRKKIFEPFFSTKGKNGTGLGMSVVYRIITSLNGDIQVTSKPNHGTSFTLTFPLSLEIPDQNNKPVIAISPKSAKSKKLNLLVVDDEVDLLKTIVEVLKMKFDRVDMATGGQEALEKIAENAYDVVLTDLGMPEMSGWEVAERVKNVLPDSKVILVTGWGSHAEEELQHHDAYVDKIISKPYDLVQLFSVIEQIKSEDHSTVKETAGN